ncbi:hypothetical protein EV421DRAFT_1740227 [Armillaria borealis]|uniref:Uncharacterized protein n=1 Tax=Armillaria borealis TaxID=47425 RepID=A0AA39J3B4_9AGAR|nr:hypothetical protein EV421DRAFT_1740227 [Armillaria borealis]
MPTPQSLRGGPSPTITEVLTCKFEAHYLIKRLIFRDLTAHLKDCASSQTPTGNGSEGDVRVRLVNTASKHPKYGLCARFQNREDEILYNDGDHIGKGIFFRCSCLRVNFAACPCEDALVIEKEYKSRQVLRSRKSLRKRVALLVDPSEQHRRRPDTDSRSESKQSFNRGSLSNSFFPDDHSLPFNLSTNSRAYGSSMSISPKPTTGIKGNDCGLNRGVVYSTAKVVGGNTGLGNIPECSGEIMGFGTAERVYMLGVLLTLKQKIGACTTTDCDDPNLRRTNDGKAPRPYSSSPLPTPAGEEANAHFISWVA